MNPSPSPNAQTPNILQLAGAKLWDSDPQGPQYLLAERTLVMGILNITPDSFSDGGNWDSPDLALDHALEMVEQGADIIDVGGEATNVKASPVDSREELSRILPVVQELASRGVCVSVDTMHHETARAVAGAGALIINDVSGGLEDDAMIRTVSQLHDEYPKLSYICQHYRGAPSIMDCLSSYRNAPAEVWQELQDRLEMLCLAGADQRRIIIDPGLGFAKTGDYNWEILEKLHTFTQSGYPVLVGASRKRFLAEIPPYENMSDVKAAKDAQATQAAQQGGNQSGAGKEKPGRMILEHERDLATAAVSTLCAASGVWGVRVHEVSASAAAVRVVEKWRNPHKHLDPVGIYWGEKN